LRAPVADNRIGEMPKIEAEKGGRCSRAPGRNRLLQGEIAFRE